MIIFIAQRQHAQQGVQAEGIEAFFVGLVLGETNPVTGLHPGGASCAPASTLPAGKSNPPVLTQVEDIVGVFARRDEGITARSAAPAHRGS